MCKVAPPTSIEAEVGRFEPRDCAKMVVAQMVEMSHMTFPAPKNKAEDDTAFLPSNPSCRPARINPYFFGNVGDEGIGQAW